MANPLSVIIAGTAAQAEVLLEALRQGGFDPRFERADSPAGLSQALSRPGRQVLVAADDLTAISLAQVLSLASTQAPGLPVLVAASTPDAAATHAALQAGAADVIWPAHLDRLALAVEVTLLAGRPRAEALGAEVDYRETFSRSRAVQLLVDPPSGVIVDANPVAAEYYGYELDRLRRMTLMELSAPDATDMRASLAGALAQGGEVITAQQRLASGAVRDVEIHASRVRRGDGQLLYLAVHDLTERHLRDRELNLVNTFATALRAVPTRAAMLPVIVEQIQQLAGAVRVALVLREAGSDEWVVVAGHGWPDPDGTPLTPDDTAREVMAGGLSEWRVVEPTGGDPAGARHFTLTTPLLAQGLAIGAVIVHLASAPSEPQLRLLSVISDMAASALQRATLHEQTEQRVQRLAALHSIDVAITASFDLRVTLSVILDHLIVQLGVDAAAVLLLNNATQTLEYGATRGFNARPLPQMPLRLSDSLPGRVVSQRSALHVTNLKDARLSGIRPYPPGQTHFTSYYGVPLQGKGRVRGVLELLDRGRMPADAEWIEYLNSLATQAAIAIDNATLFVDLQRSNVELSLAYEATIEGWARVLEARGVETSGHTRRVADLTLKLAQAAGFAADELVNVRRGALLHDVGMLSIPERVLLKPSLLSEDERAIVRRHPEYGFELLAPIVYLRPALDIPYCHHERWDGSGYPRGLRAEQIPLAARLFAVVDNWDALQSDRPYREAWHTAAAVDYVRGNAGKQFDPDIVALFLQNTMLGPA